MTQAGFICVIGFICVSVVTNIMTIQNSLKHYRTEKNLTQEDLAVAVGVSRQTIIAIEKGNYTPSLMLAMQLAQYFTVPVEKLFVVS